MSTGLHYFFEPNGIAVYGASTNPQKAGHQIVKNIIDSGYQGRVAPVSVGGEEVLGLPGYRDLPSIEHRIELVVLSAPAKATPQFVEQLEQRFNSTRDIGAIICAAAGFAEIGTDEGKRYQDMLTDFCSRNGVRLLGPNCVGTVDINMHLNATFIADITHVPGGISFVSQSGAVGAWLLMSWSATPGGGVGFNKFMSVGNMADVDIIEGLEYAGNDERTRVLGLYIEGSPDARKLVHTLGSIAEKKPVVILKVGRTEEGAKAAASHTGSLAGTDALYDGAFKQFGIVRTDTIEELSDTMRAFDTMPLPEDNRVFIYTQAGGPGIFCVDEMASSGSFSTAYISDESKAQLKEVLPPIASVCEPEGHADITAAATAQQHIDGLEVLLRDPEVDAVFFITVATLFLDLEEMARGMSELLERLEREEGIRKPVFPVIISGNYVWASRRILEENRIPTFASPDRAVKVLDNMIRYSRYRNERGDKQ
jgi:acyl-CoA synthetase (NDP forming)